MIAKHLKTSFPVVATVVAMTLAMLTVAGAAAAAAPVKLILTSHFGREVNLTQVNAKGGPALEDVCTVASKDECQTGKEGTIPGAFTNNPESVAGAPSGHVYVADQGNHRVQELTATGAFVSMFGKEVDATEPGDICTAASGHVCKAGVEGAAPGQFSIPQSVTVDPVSGDVYVAEFVFGSGAPARRVQKFTAAGQFVLEIGKEVNATTKANLCTQEEVEKSGVTCTGPAEVEIGKNEQGAFRFAQFRGDLLAAGGPEDLLYVGDEHRVQEFSAATGEYKREISLPNTVVTALAVDGLGDSYLVDQASNVVREFDPTGVEGHQFAANPAKAGGEIHIGGMAIDSSGLLAATELEFNNAEPSVTFGSLFNASTGHLLTEFTLPHFSSGIGFNGSRELFAVVSAPEVLAYEPVNVAELVANPAACAPGAEHETDATFDCSLNGEVDPWGVSETEAWLQWARTPALGEESTPQPIKNAKEPPVEGEEEPLVPVSAAIEGVRPNDTLYYRLVGRDAHVHPPELLTSETTSFTTPLVAPKILSESISFVHSSSAVLSGALNPEHANTRYEFDYGPCEENNPEKCPVSAYPLKTTPAESAAYGKIGATFEIVELQPETVYHCRILAVSENGGKTERQESQGPEKQFTTGPAPKVHARTGGASLVGTTSATLSGTVEPDAQAASYTFELGVYAGAETQYGIVVSGAVPASAVSVAESLGVTGLQPGTEYAYRIAIASGYGREQGEPVTFTTEGLPSVIVPPIALPMLNVPKNIHFPKPAKVPPKKKKIKHKKRGGKRTGKRAVNRSNAHRRASHK